MIIRSTPLYNCQMSALTLIKAFNELVMEFKSLGNQESTPVSLIYTSCLDKMGKQNYEIELLNTVVPGDIFIGIPEFITWYSNVVYTTKKMIDITDDPKYYSFLDFFNTYIHERVTPRQSSLLSKITDPIPVFYITYSKITKKYDGGKPFRDLSKMYEQENSFSQKQLETKPFFDHFGEARTPTFRNQKSPNPILLTIEKYKFLSNVPINRCVNIKFEMNGQYHMVKLFTKDDMVSMTSFSYACAFRNDIFLTEDIKRDYGINVSLNFPYISLYTKQKNDLMKELEEWTGLLAQTLRPNKFNIKSDQHICLALVSLVGGVITDIQQVEELLEVSKNFKDDVEGILITTMYGSYDN